MLFFIDLAFAPLQFVASVCDELTRPNVTLTIRTVVLGPAQVIHITPERRARRERKILRRLGGLVR
ncbi:MULTISPECIES: hypothetical protein [Bradyrhizobium]|uniref:Uncharacterized protein n=1 Tax=Bradyrhizobium septentrionale TaxID=1404411 RepID=A0A973W2A0_9BRAD|nr:MULTISPECIES: hypothetical protein [Bradyrhizobium]UGY14626.1 hypothetical protein HAP48_0039770 [Bradyrhizobium septentrionale]UGY23133.1 hypothetical protein HU675_0035020 [Bradyrhizobium septentrionale]